MPHNKYLFTLVFLLEAFGLEWFTFNVVIPFKFEFVTFDWELLLDDKLEQPVIFNLVITLSDLVEISSIGGN